MANLEVGKMYNILREVRRLAANASLTGALEKGTPTLVAAYNKCLTALKEQGDETAAQLFPELAPNAGVDDVGVAAALLASYLKPERRLHEHDIMAFNEDHYGYRHEDDEDEDEDHD